MDVPVSCAVAKVSWTKNSDTTVTSRGEVGTCSTSDAAPLQVVLKRSIDHFDPWGLLFIGVLWSSFHWRAGVFFSMACCAPPSSYFVPNKPHASIQYTLTNVRLIIHLLEKLQTLDK